MKFAATLALASALRLRVQTREMTMNATGPCQQTNTSAPYASGNAYMCNYYNNGSSSCTGIGGYYGCSWTGNSSSNSTSSGSDGVCIYTPSKDKYGTYNYCKHQHNQARCLDNAYGGVDYGCSWSGNGTSNAAATSNYTAASTNTSAVSCSNGNEYNVMSVYNDLPTGFQGNCTYNVNGSSISWRLGTCNTGGVYPINNLPADCSNFTANGEWTN